MEENIKNVFSTTKEGTYVINDQFQIIYIDEALQTIFPDAQVNANCYRVLQGNEHPCKNCPVLDHRQSKSTLKSEVMFSKIINSWLSCTMMRIDWPEKGMCAAFTIRNIMKDGYYQVRDVNKLHYNNFAELDLYHNTYHLVQHNSSILASYPSTGLLHETILKLCNTYIIKEDQKDFLDFFDATSIKHQLTKREYISKEFRIYQEDHSCQWVTLYIKEGFKEDLKEENGQICLCFIVKSNRIYHHEQNEELSAFGLYDPLTGLYNFNTFCHHVIEALQTSKQAYGIIAIDIEHFKLFNDWYGMQQGDKLLTYVADKIKRKVEQYKGSACRISGDDFIMLLPKAACDVEQLEQEIVGWIKDYDRDIKFLPVVGIYLIQEQDTSVTLMCDRASLAVDSVKGNFARRVAVYNDSMKQKLENEQEVLFGVKQGLHNGEFEVYYQPQCSARTKKVLGAEALVRWQHPDKGMLPPSYFIPLLETSGFIYKLDYYVWESVCAFLSERLAHHLPVVPISVNVSRIDIFQFNLVDVFRYLVQKYKLTPKLLEIEITESAYTENFNQLIDSVMELRREGFTILMDDFGSGYSSLNMLKDVEIDVLKIDMKFLEMTDGSAAKGSSILESIIRMGKWLGLRLIAEGVETSQQVDKLLNLDCEYMQGYYFYRPMCQEMFSELLQQPDKIDPRGILARRMPTINLDDLFHKDITSEAMLNNILGGIALYEVVDDKQLIIQMVNDKYYRMTGCNPVDLREKSQSIVQQVYQDDLPIIWDVFQRAQKANVLGASGTFRRYRLNGEIMWMNLRAYFLKKEGNRKLFYGVITDVSENVRLQRELQVALDAIPGDVIEFTIDKGTIKRRIISCGLADVHGYTREEYKRLLESDQILKLIDPDDKERVGDVLLHPQKWKNGVNIVFATHAKNGSKIWLEQSIRPIQTVEGIDIYSSLCTNITKLKDKEQELLDSQKVLHDILHLPISILQEPNVCIDDAVAQIMPGGIMGIYCKAGCPIYFIEPSLIQLLGYDHLDDLRTATKGYMEELIHASDRARVIRDLYAEAHEEREYATRLRLLCKDGSYLWVMVKGRIMRYDQQLAFIAFYMDITGLLKQS